MAEVFKQTYTLKANKEQFADKRSSDIWDDFTNNTTVATQQAAESGTNVEVDFKIPPVITGGFQNSAGNVLRALVLPG
ncbi:hypothetical protein PIB30_100168 [Stylosanthes scabra]|uniref:Uncharacterized protein n=1 Tax=Stylosanthes scabra TaxID=79078 RepID=A0ABU6SXN6_9FABA|nr:hypothetical protein [Stylosanthes scabra]